MLKHILLITILFSCSTEIKDISINGETMGTQYAIKYLSSDHEQNEIIENEIIELLHKIDKIEMSTWTSKSELSKFNLSTETTAKSIPKSLYKVIEKSIEISKLSDGAFDVTVMPLVNLWGFGWQGRPKSDVLQSSLDSIKEFIGYENISLLANNKIAKRKANLMIDLSSIAKGYGVDVIATLLDKKEIKSYLVEIGGEVRSKGLKQDVSA
jgi:Membrane-associated lipoprotein involved in thiamine biosynthesis